MTSFRHEVSATLQLLDFDDVFDKLVPLEGNVDPPISPIHIALVWKPPGLEDMGSENGSLHTTCGPYHRVCHIALLLWKWTSIIGFYL